MTDTTTTNSDMPNDIKPEVPSGINVLTILTFIGCAIFFILNIVQFLFAKSGLEKMEQTINSSNFENMPGIVKSMYTPEMMDLARKQLDNRTPILLINVLAIVLCFIGALQMRKLKMQGYYMYIAGELLPLVGTLVFVGALGLSGFRGIFIVAIILLFIILYTAQRKKLVNP
jgi:uncharacterized membrane protein